MRRRAAQAHLLIEDIASRTVGKGKYEMHYAAPQTTLFGVPIVSEKVRMLFGQRGIATHYGHTLKAIDPGRKVATFATTDASGATGTAEMAYDYLHVIPPQRAPDVIRQSGLSWADKWTDQGWVEVDSEDPAPPALPGGLRRRRRGRRAEGQDGGERQVAGAGRRGSPRGGDRGQGGNARL